MPPILRRYLHYVERDTKDVSPIWKVSHALIFILLVFTSYTSAYIFHNIFASFNFQCVLYAKTSLTLEKPRPVIITMEETISNTTMTTMKSVEDSDSNDNSNLTEVIYLNGVYWLRNSTMEAKVVVDYRQTFYGSIHNCNAVLFFPLATLVLASFGAVMVMVYGRGGKGYKSEILHQPWEYVYPLLIFSLIMVIITSAMTSLLSNGMEFFCEGFRPFTKQPRCSNKINDFTDRHSSFGSKDLYEMYINCFWAHVATVILWALQVALLVARVVFAVDFQLKMMTVSFKKQDPVEYKKVHQALKRSYTGLRRVSLNVPLPVPTQEADEDNTDTTLV